MILLNLLGAIAILLWSTRMVRLGVSRYMGSRLSEMIKRATKNRVRASITGIGIAGMLQSASATGVLASSFAKKGVLSVSMGIAVLLGADVGSTIMVQVLTFDVSWLSPIAFLCGYIVFIKGSDARKSEIGRAMMGIGLIILSLQIMSHTMEPLRASADFAHSIEAFSNQKILAFIAVAFATWFMHSSIAMVLIIISLATGGDIELPFALLLTLGANVGASFIPLALTFQSTAEAKSIPLGSLILRSCGAIIALPFLNIISIELSSVINSAGLGIAIFHTVFNLFVLIIGLPLIDTVEKICKRVFPPHIKGATLGAKLLNADDIKTPSVALEALAKEITIQAEYVEQMLASVIEIIKTDDFKRIEEVAKMDDYVDALYEDIKIYTTKVSVSVMTDDEAIRATNTITYTTNLEHAGDIIEKNLLDCIAKKIQGNIYFSSAGWKEIQSLHNALMEQLRLSIKVFNQGKVEDARQLLEGKKRLQKMESVAKDLHFERLRKGVDNSIKSSTVHLDIVQDLKRINSHLCSIAYPILEKHGELHNSRLKN